MTGIHNGWVPGPALLPAAAARAVDRLAAERYGLATLVLMESAGRALAEAAIAAVQRMSPSAASRPQAAGRRPVATVLAGTGQNGGDGFVAARHLQAAGWDVAVWLAGNRARLQGDALVNWTVLQRSGVLLRSFADDGAAAQQELEERLDSSAVIIDAVLGTGFRGALRGVPAAALTALHRWRGQRPGRTVPVIAADVPSGVAADTGAAAPEAVRADVTVAFVAAKPGLHLEPGRSLAGTVLVDTLGVPPSCVVEAATGERWHWYVTDPAVLRGWLPGRPVAAHKHSAGHVIVLAGAPGYSGAAVLAARAALRGGAGLVTVGTAAGSAGLVAAALPEAMVRPLAETGPLLVKARAIAAGPGLVGHEEQALQLLAAESAQPWVLDAAVLRALGGQLSTLRGLRPERLVLTPHAGELAALLGCTTADVVADRAGALREAAAASGATVVLKGAPTLIAQPGGPDRPGCVCINTTGHPVLATAGSGDVLTGLIAALLAQGLAPWPAAVLGAHWHGLAGDWLAGEQGPVGATAGDVCEALLPARRLLVEGTA